MITYDRLWETMKKRGITQYHLIKREKFSAGQIGRLKNKYDCFYTDTGYSVPPAFLPH